MLAKVRALLPARYGMTNHCYKGRPFSYCMFLDKATIRPTNMNPRRPVAVLPYSES
jgi:hypothetical protein